MDSFELKIPPVAQVLIAGLSMWGISCLVPFSTFVVPGNLWLAGVSCAAGVAISLLGVVAFRKAQTTVDPRIPQEATSLVRSGIYRRSRNPMYLGFLFVLIGWGLFLSHGLALLLLPAFVLYMNRFQIRPEERFMVEKFGDEYNLDVTEVRRWI